MGQIVFSKSPIQFKNENESEFTSTFTFPDEKPYFMAYFPKSIANRCLEEHGFLPLRTGTKIVFSFSINGENVASVEEELALPQLNQWTGWSDPNFPLGKDKNLRSKYSIAYLDHVIPKIKKGSNTIKMAVGYKAENEGKMYTNKLPFSEGQFVLNANAAYKKVLQKAPQAVMNDSALEKQIQETLAFRWRKTTIIDKVILTEKDWRIETNALGVPVHKVLRVYAITHPNPEKYSKEESSKCYATPYEVKREYIGNNQYSDKILWHSSGGRANYEVECP